jgi:chemotaxis protein MotB
MQMSKNTISILGHEEPKLYSNTTWMVTFADLISLLLVFFILMYSTNSVDSGHWKKVVESLDHQFHKGRAKVDGMFNTNFKAPAEKMVRGMDLNYLYSVLSAKVNADAVLADKIAINNDGNNLVLSIENAYLFDSNTPIITDDARAALFTIGESMQKANNRIEIISYIEKKGSNSLPKEWNLSLERSIAIATEFRKFGNSSTLDTLVKQNNENSGKVDVVIHEFVN